MDAGHIHSNSKTWWLKSWLWQRGFPEGYIFDTAVQPLKLSVGWGFEHSFRAPASTLWAFGFCLFVNLRNLLRTFTVVAKVVTVVNLKASIRSVCMVWERRQCLRHHSVWCRRSFSSWMRYGGALPWRRIQTVMTATTMKTAALTCAASLRMAGDLLSPSWSSPSSTTFRTSSWTEDCWSPSCPTLAKLPRQKVWTAIHLRQLRRYTECVISSWLSMLSNRFQRW